MINLGKRIAIIGPSNSGKSTLAVALANKLDIPFYHLDQLAHKPGTNWQRVPNDQLVAAHDKIIQKQAWVMDGNYSICMPQRFVHASTVIWLDPRLFGCIARYIKRSLHSDNNRAGSLPGARKEFSLTLIKYTLFNYPKNKRKYRALLENYPDLNVMVFKKLVSLPDLYG